MMNMDFNIEIKTNITQQKCSDISLRVEEIVYGKMRLNLTLDFTLFEGFVQKNSILCIVKVNESVYMSPLFKDTKAFYTQMQPE